MEWIDEKDSWEIFGHGVIILQKWRLVFFIQPLVSVDTLHFFHICSEFPYLLLDLSMPYLPFRGHIVFGPLIATFIL